MAKSVFGRLGQKSQATVAPRTHTVVGGESLMSIAQLEYQTGYSSELWRQIAEANGITDPDTIVPGQLLLIPDPITSTDIVISDVIQTVGTPGAISAVPASAGIGGQGVSYPLSFNAQGRLDISSGEQSVRESIFSMLLTFQHDRPAEDDYGANVGAFEPDNTGLIADALGKCMADHDDRARILSVDLVPTLEQGSYDLTVTFQMAGSTGTSTYTYPAYQLVGASPATFGGGA